MQPGCRCQKHPCTIMMARYRGKTISGLPGRSLRWSLKRNPSLWAIRRTTSSGLVSRPRIRDMISLRLARSKMSLISQSVGRHPRRPAMSVKPALDRSVIVAGSRTPTRREPPALVEDQPDLFDPWPLSWSSAVSDWESARQRKPAAGRPRPCGSVARMRPTASGEPGPRRASSESGVRRTAPRRTPLPSPCLRPPLVASPELRIPTPEDRGVSDRNGGTLRPRSRRREKLAWRGGERQPPRRGETLPSPSSTTHGMSVPPSRISTKFGENSSSPRSYQFDKLGREGVRVVAELCPELLEGGAHATGVVGAPAPPHLPE